MDRKSLMQYLPHRDNMLLLDRCELTKDNKSVAQYTIKSDEFFLQGHFPDNPVVPGVILCEIMAQACCVLIQEKNSQGNKKTAYFSSIKDAKFRGIVRPQDVLDIQTEITRKIANFYFAKGQITVAGKLVASAEFSFAVVERAE